jgi:hypothetical protein
MPPVRLKNTAYGHHRSSPEPIQSAEPAPKPEAAAKPVLVPKKDPDPNPDPPVKKPSVS